jgi:hypothetical protein
MEASMLFSERSVWTMVHGVGLGTAALLGLAAALFAIHLLRSGELLATGAEGAAAAVGRLTAVTALATWAACIVGTYVVFPPYRAPAPEGATDLAAYPRSFVLASPGTAWLHSFAMETKEHLPWIAAMLCTAVGFVAWRYGARLLRQRELRGMAATLLAISFGIVAYASLLGMFVNKVAPVE